MEPTKVICFINRNTNEKGWTDECQTPDEFQTRYPDCQPIYILDAMKY